MKETIQFRLRKRAEIRRQIPDRKSVQEGKPDRLADLLDEAATYIDYLEDRIQEMHIQEELCKHSSISSEDTA